MSREEILVGLNNAIARGESLEKAMQSLVTAGYNPLEVQEAAKKINMGVIGTIAEQPQPMQTITQAKSGYKPLPATNVAQKPKKKSHLLLIILLVIILLALMGLGVFVFFGEQILNVFFPKVA